MNNLHYPLFLLGLLVVAGALHAEPDVGLTLTISFADEEPVTVQIRDGGLASYKSYRFDNTKLGVIPVLRDGEEVELHLVTITGERPNYRPSRIIVSFEGSLGFEMVTTWNGLPVSITTNRDTIPTDRQTPCSVACGGSEVTGLAVRMECGSC